ncbi:MAG: hypothetical protein HFF17_08715 [Oscillospiraceae bacterium]|nr:hypothetical protein [Oscillospiraceae bacterium]
MEKSVDDVDNSRQSRRFAGSGRSATARIRECIFERTLEKNKIMSLKLWGYGKPNRSFFGHKKLKKRRSQ